MSVSPPWDDLDPGITDVVRLLFLSGFRTTDSGDGIYKLGGPQEDTMLKVPHVVVSTAVTELIVMSHALMSLLEEQGIRMGPDQETVEELAGPQAEGTEFGDGVTIEASYDPATRSALILLTGLDNTMLATCRARD